MRKLHLKTSAGWQPVFCRLNGAVVTCPDAPQKALPSIAAHGASDLAWFRDKFADHEFCLMVPKAVHHA